MTLLLIAVAAVPVFLSGEIQSSLGLLFFPGLAAAFFTSATPWPRYLVVTVTTLLGAALLLLVFVSTQSGDWLVNSIAFALLATLTRSLQITSSRQVFQGIALSFLLLVAAAVTNPDVSFAIFYVIYAVLLTWTLTYAHLTQVVEESHQSSGMAWKAARFVTGRFLAASCLLALGLLVVSTLIFFLFPRLGLGFFSAQTRRGDPITGFTDSVELGHFGNLADSSRVVLRVEFSSGKEYLPPASLLRFRGMAFDRYDGRGWSRSTDNSSLLRSGGDGFCEVWGYPSGPLLRYDMVEYDVYQEPLEIESRVLFGIDRPLYIKPVTDRFDRFRGLKRSYYEDDFQNLGYSSDSMSSMNYTVRSGLLHVSPGKLRNLPARYTEEEIGRFTQLPAGFDPRVADLARTAAGSAQDVYDVASNVEQFLQSNFRYTTQGEGVPEDPVATFLFERKEGHCEYFASAMVLMLRTLGIPARPVNGFLGASYNEFGDYYSVSEGSAHTWVEVAFPMYGWIAFDPTPAQERRPEEQGLLLSVNLWLDSLKLAWYKWVIEYDLERQISFYAGLWNALAPTSRQVEFSPDLNVFEMRNEFRKISRTVFSRQSAVLFGTLLALMVLGPLVGRRLRGIRKGRRDELDRIAADLRTALRAKGLDVAAGTTVPQMSRTALASGFEASAELARLSVLLEKARFDPASTPDLKAIRNLWNRVRFARRLRPQLRG
jgi:transglutaminase-like putative cysteine protease